MAWWVWIAWRFLFSVSYSRLYREHHKIHEALPVNTPIKIYINRIYNRLVFKIKGECKLELQTPETIKLYGSTKKMNIQNKEWKKCTSLEMAEVVLV